jgi:uncharacterized protein with GYD domain
MATFIMAMTINPTARKDHTDLAHQITTSLDSFSSDDIKDIRLFATLGRYDCLAVFEATNQTAAFKVASTIMARGVLETETWPVIDFDDFISLLR